jgi:hypothetical protein
MKAVLDAARADFAAGNGWPTLDASFQQFKQLVVLNSFAGSNGGRLVFKVEDVAKILTYATEG